MAIPQTRLTFEQFLRLPEEKPALEYLDGAVTQKMAPKGPHGRLQLWAGMFFEVAAGDPPRFLAFTELRTHWSDRASLVPDVSVYLIDRIPVKPNGEVDDDFWEPPDIALEIASPGQSARQMTERARWLVENGVRIVVVVEPRQHRVRVARPGQEIATFQGDDRVDLGDVLPDFSFVVGDLFAAIRVRRPGDR
jgi:Uma2 family endonuclease